MIVGLTGGIGSGKTTVAHIFKKQDNIALYNADSEAKKLMNSSLKIKTKIINFFGQESYVNNMLHKEYLAKLVFNNKEALKSLNKIVHPEVKLHFQKFVKEHQKKEYILYENAILFESKSNIYCDVIISVYAPLKLRIERAVLRDNSSKEEVMNRIKNQWKEDKKLLQSNYIISNLAKENTELQVVRIHNILTKRKGLI